MRSRRSEPPTIVSPGPDLKRVSDLDEAERLADLADRWQQKPDEFGWLSFYCPFGGYLFAVRKPNGQWWKA